MKRSWVASVLIVGVALIIGWTATLGVERNEASRWLGIDDPNALSHRFVSTFKFFAAAVFALGVLGTLSRSLYAQPIVTSLILAAAAWFTSRVIGGLALASLMSGSGSGLIARFSLVMLFLTIIIMVPIVRTLPIRERSPAPAIAQALIAAIVLLIVVPQWSVIRRKSVSPEELEREATKRFGPTYVAARDLVRQCQWVNVHTGGLKRLAIAPARRNGVTRFSTESYEGRFDFDYVGGLHRGRIALRLRHDGPNPRAPFRTTDAEVQVMIHPEGGDVSGIPASCPTP